METGVVIRKLWTIDLVLIELESLRPLSVSSIEGDRMTRRAV